MGYLESGDRLIPEFDGLRLWWCRIDSGFGELDSCHDDSSESPNFQEPSGGRQSGGRVKLQQAPAYDELARVLDKPSASGLGVVQRSAGLASW